MNFSKNIKTLTEVGACAAGATSDRTFQFRIPTDNEKIVNECMDDNGKEAGENPLAMMGMYPSVNGCLVSIKYVLKVSV